MKCFLYFSLREQYLHILIYIKCSGILGEQYLHILLLVYDYLSLILPSLVGGLIFFLLSLDR